MCVCVCIPYIQQNMCNNGGCCSLPFVFVVLFFALDLQLFWRYINCAINTDISKANDNCNTIETQHSDGISQYNLLCLIW